MITVEAMPGSFGAYVHGVDLGRLPSADEMRRLAEALFDHRILVFRDQRPSLEEYARFGRQWGEPIEFFVPGARDRRFPELIRIHNSPRTPDAQRDGAMHWHADSSYEAVPASVTMLLAEEAPSEGNETLFADCVAAYEALPQELSERIAGLEVIHDPSGGKVALEGESRGRGEGNGLPVVTHPLVTVHPVTGRKALYGFSGTAAGIVGMEEQEAIDLLVRVKRHVLQEEFRQSAKAESGTILMWDNYSVVHSATPTEYSDEAGKRRLLYRISTRGVPGVLAHQQGVAPS